ncbi:venom allergen 3-like [Atheta coriaria]|uniref:venom allergen 3-like n=1 Tax=Dalotia coriaria TaxID=877792 RepID=UPI0031F346D8
MIIDGIPSISTEDNVLLTKPSSLAFYASQNTNSSMNKYCRTCCIDVQVKTVGKKCGSHTLCKYANQKIGPACKGYVPVLFSDTEKHLLVDAHNTIRNKVASGVVPAGNMRMLEWDDELAATADRWAAQCIFGNDICRDLERFPVGQNIARGSIATDGVMHLLEMWYQGAEYINKSIVQSYKLPRGSKRQQRLYTMYSQLVWADTYLIGCARVIFQTTHGPKVQYTQHLICNYGPTGNIPNQRMYKIGTPCSECQEGTSCHSEYEALCATDTWDAFDDYFLHKKVTYNNGTQLAVQKFLVNLICALLLHQW